MGDSEQKVTVGSMDLLNSMQLTEKTAGLDGASKLMLHNIEVVSFILKQVVPEFKYYSLDEVKGFIYKDSIIEDLDVSPGRTNTVLTGESTEYQALNEKTSNFDLALSAKNPELLEADFTVKIHFDFEPQLNYRPGYPIEKRGYYYLARRVSSQLSLVTEDTDYGVVEKCCSIWICRDRVPVNERYSVSVFEITNTQNSGDFKPNHEDYDLMTLIIIRLGDLQYSGNEEDEYYDLFKFLNLIMYPHDENFISDMKEYVDFSSNTELWKGADKMSGLGMAVLNDGIAIGKKEENERLNKLISILIADNRIEDLKHSTEDGEFQQKLLDELVPVTVDN